MIIKSIENDLHQDSNYFPVEKLKSPKLLEFTTLSQPNGRYNRE